MFETNEAQETIVLLERKGPPTPSLGLTLPPGFVRLALVSGAQIIPCYVFGNTQCLSVISDERRLLASVSRVARFTFSIFYGRGWTPIARRTPLLIVLGRPLRLPLLPAGTEPSRAQVDRYHEQFMDSVYRLFERYKAAYGWEDRQLLIK